MPAAIVARVRAVPAVTAHMKRYAHLAVPLAATLAYVLLILAVFRQCYWENDNLGILDDIKQGHTVSYMSVLLGRVLSFLYRSVSDAIPWYGLLLYAVLTAAFFLGAVSIQALCRGRLLKSAFLVVLAVLCTRFVVTVGYNSASITVGFATLTALMIYLRRTGKPRVGVLLALGVLFTFTYLLRISGLRAVGLFAALVVGYELATRLRMSLGHFVIFLLPMVLVVAADTGLSRYAVDDGFERFLAWNRVRGKTHGFPVLALNVDNPAVLEANDWEPVHFVMLRSWAFFDEEAFNIETLSNIRKHSVPLPGENGLPVGAIARNGLGLLADHWPQWLGLVALVGLAALGGRRRSVVAQSLHVLYFLGGGALMATFLRFPGRIAYPLFAGALLFSFYLLFRDETETAPTVPTGTRARLAVLVPLILLAVAAVDGWSVGRRIVETDRRQRQYYANEDTLRALDPEIVLLAGGRAPGRQCRDPLRAHRDCLPVVPAGWGIFSPRFYGFLGEHGLEKGSELVHHMVQRERAFVVSHKFFAELMARYLWQTHRIHVRHEFVCELSDDVNVYRLVNYRPSWIDKREAARR